MIKADNGRIEGWRIVREYLKAGAAYTGEPKIKISRECKNLIRSLPLLRFDERVKEDAASTPHEITHAPEALRYALMSRQPKTPPKRFNSFSRSIYSFENINRDEREFAEFLDN